MSERQSFVKIGFDFGTTYSKISYLNDFELEEFRYPGKNGFPYIASAVAYQQVAGAMVVSAGRSARSAAIHSSEVTFCENFKMLLPLDSSEEWKKAGWRAEKTPAAVAADYFRRLLIEGPDSFRSAQGPIQAMVVSIPEEWRRRIRNHHGAELLREALVDQLNLPLESLQSEPICAAAYYAHSYAEDRRLQSGQRHFEGNLLVCDMGGGTFDVALCHIDGDCITVKDSEGSTALGPGCAGVCFDSRAVERARDPQGNPPPLGGIQGQRALRAFEEAKIDLHEQTAKKLMAYALAPKLVAGEDMYEFQGQYKISFAQVEDAFAPVKAAIAEVLGRIKSRAGQQGMAIDRIAIVGGFGLFPLARKAILESLGLSDNDPRYVAQLPNSEFAVSRGAALIANQRVQVMQHFGHAIGLEVLSLHGTGPLEIREIFPAGSLRAGQQPAFFDDRGAILDVAPNFHGRLSLFVKPKGQDRWVGLAPRDGASPPPGKYRIGITVDESNFGTLVLRPKDNRGRDIYYQLGKMVYADVPEKTSC